MGGADGVSRCIGAPAPSTAPNSTPGPADGPRAIDLLAIALLVIGLLVLGLAWPAAASPDGSMCRMECGAQFTERNQNPASVQTCLVRCAARAAAMGAANVTAATVMPNPRTPWTLGPGGRPAPPPDLRQAVERQARKLQQRDAAREATREATRGRRPAPGPAAPAGAAPAPGPVTRTSLAPAPAGVSLLGALMAAAVPVATAAPLPPAARAPAAGGGPHGAIYLAAAPSRGYGLAVGAADRASAHRAAEAACRGGTGHACRPAGDVPARCAAVVHALRSNNAVVMTAHPSTYTVLAATTGSGPTRADAERQALLACRPRGRGAACQVTEARCAE